MIPVSQPSIGEEELQSIREVFESHWLGMGEATRQFEEAVAHFLGDASQTQVIAVNSGTSALYVALDVIGVGPGDEVIVPSLTFAATLQVITALHATPVFCDVDEDTLTMDVDDVAQCITSKTRVLLPVHYRGVPCDMEKLQALARRHHLRIVEDAAHAFGSSYQGRRIGSFGDLTCFSFDPIKNITCGEGGAVTTRDSQLAEKLRQMRLLGIVQEETAPGFVSPRITQQGYRCHLSNINAAIGLVQMKKFENMNQRKWEIAERYDAAFKDIPDLELLKSPSDDVALFTYIAKILRGKREAFRKTLEQNGIGSRVHYTPAHQFRFFKRFSRRPLPVTESVSQQIVTLPLFPDMTNDQVEDVIRAVKTALGAKKKTARAYSRIA